jgi:hypothetical protein
MIRWCCGEVLSRWAYKVVEMLLLRLELAAILSLPSRWFVGILVVRMYCPFMYLEDEWQTVLVFWRLVGIQLVFYRLC